MQLAVTGSLDARGVEPALEAASVPPSPPVDLARLGNAVRTPPSREALPLMPPVPERLEDTGLSSTFLEQLLLRTLYVRGEKLGRDLARDLGLRFSLIDGFLETFKRSQLVQVKKNAGMGNVSSSFCLSEQGRHLAREHMESNQYVGPAPVPLQQYAQMAKRQRQPQGWLTPEMLREAYKKLVISDEVLSQIGPAVGSGHSFLIYGQPGNGKTFLAEALVGVDRSCIYMPYAIEHQGSIIQLYDNIFHQIIEDEASDSAISMEPSYDRRWFKCRRPFIVSGGELALSMLDLSYNPVSKVYDAPLQLKANNGIYLIDDFGRQRATPAEVLNRWIVPMERRVDFLTLQTGGKVTVPFEAFIVFSTNLRPDQLGDEAFLRRIHYKMHLKNPSVGEFRQIFDRFCDQSGLTRDDATVESFVRRHYVDAGRRMRRCHPRDILSHAIDLLNFERRELVLTGDVLERAYNSCFTEVGDMEA